MKRKFLCFLMVFSILFVSACASNPPSDTDVFASGTGAPSSSVTDISASDTDDSGGTDSLLSTDLSTGSTFSSDRTVDLPSDTSDSDTSTDTVPDVPYTEITDETAGTSSARPSSTNSATNKNISSSTSSATASSTTKTSSASTNSGTADSDTPVDIPTRTVTDLVIACDQTVGRVVVYDLEKYNGSDLESCAVWSYTPPIKSGSSVHRSQLMSGVKYRTGTVFGDVVLMCASGRYAEIVTYPDKTVIWRDEWTVNQVNNGTGVKNPHAIEILPSGNVVVAGSSGNVVRLFYTSSRISDTSASVSSVAYELEDAHGVLWDPQYQILWALGKSELVAYTLSGSGTSQTLVKCNSYALPTLYGHDLSADFTSVNGLWITTNSGVYYFDKTTGRFSTNYLNSNILNRSAVKGFGNNRNESYFFCFPNYGVGRAWASEDYASWCTDTIQYGYYNSAGKFTVIPCKSATSAFYKVYSFQGQYQ